MSQMCPNCSFDNPDDAQTCARCSSALRGLLGENTLLSGRYQVTSVLGCGAMGAVYLAEDKRLVGRRCAIKENRTDLTTNPQAQAQAREQFLAEASVLARLDHASLPKVSDYFIENNREYLVMDYVDGEDLESRLQRTAAPLSEELVITVADQVLDALAYLHGQIPQPIIHRDIKPANLRLNVQGRVKLVDFGLVKILDANKPETKVELRGLGTPAYAPLEQFAGSDDHTDVRSDIYSLGATMYHLLTHLYPPDVHQRLLHPQTLIPPQELNDKLSPKTEQVVLKAMEIYPQDRYQSANEMRQALRDPDLFRTTVLPAPKAKQGSALTTLFATIGLVVVLGLLGLFAFALFNRERSDASPISSPGSLVDGAPTVTPTELIPQALSDAPTDTPTATSAASEATPLPEETPTPEATPTAIPSPTPTPRTPTPTPTDSEPSVASGETIPASTLSGTIAYPVFNGTTYDLYFGQADGSGVRLFRQQASQPAFSPDGSRIAFHSWRLDEWGLLNADLSGANEILIATFVEDQLPSWSADGNEIVYLSRREGDRKSRLVKVGSFQQRSNGQVIGEGEYPTIGLNNRLAFKGWGASGNGIRTASLQFQNLQAVTDREVDTAPAPSPDGDRIAFMSLRDGNWEIYVVNADGSNLQRLTDDPGQDGLPTWSPDGEAIAFVSSRGGSWGIWAMTPDGDDQQELFPMGGSPDGFVGSSIATAASRGWAEERISWTR